MSTGDLAEQAQQPSKPKVVVLISGSGSNLQALIDQTLDGTINAEIAAVISNKPNVFGLERAQKAAIPAITIDHKEFSERELFDANLVKKIDEFSPDLIVLAGFMRILTENFVKRYYGKLINIHPSLLPKYPGLNTHQRAIEAGDKEHGLTTHFVVPELDSGPHIIQGVVPILPQDTPEKLAQRVQVQEHVLYPITVKWFVEGRLSMEGEFALLDGKPIPKEGLRLEPENTLH